MLKKQKSITDIYNMEYATYITNGLNDPKEVKQNEIFNQSYKQNFINEKLEKLYIHICLTDLPIFKNFYNKLSSKIDLNSLSRNAYISKLPNYEYLVAKYVFMRIFRFIFFLDFIHDFCNTGRNNILFKNTKNNNREIKDNLIQIYKEQYNKDIIDVKNHIFKIDIDSLVQIDTKLKFLNFNEFNNFDELEKIIFTSEDKIKEYITKILNYFDIENIIDVNPKKYNCYSSLNTILNVNSIDNNINFYIDTDKSKYDLYPIIMRMCDMLFNADSKYKFIINSSILDNYDSASTSALSKVFESFTDNYDRFFPKKKDKNRFIINNLNYKSIKIVIKLDPDDLYLSNFIDLNFDMVKDKNDENKIKTGLSINRFFMLESPMVKTDPKIYNFDSSLSNISYLLKECIEEKDYGSLVLNSYYKTMGDFSQALLCYQQSIIEPNQFHVFISFDKISSYISSLFNVNTLRENYNNPIMPLSYFKYNWNDFDNMIVDKEEETRQSQYGKQKTQSNKSDKLDKNIKIERIHNLAKKYNVSYKNLTYKQLYDKLHKLYKLQLLAKKMKIPITYTKGKSTNKGTKQNSQNKRIYKSISMLENETKKLNKKIKK